MLGEKIKQARIELNWTQAQLAVKLKVNKNCVSNWEREKQIPTKEMQKKLERILKIKLAEEEKTTHKSQKKNSIKNKIQQARKEKKLTQKELASKLGVSASSISSWENNKSTPNAEIQEKLYQILGLDCTDLEARKVRQNKKEVKQVKETVTQQQDEIAPKQDEVSQKQDYGSEYKILPVGETSFKEIIKTNMYYADHTRVIKDVIQLSGKIKLITRPRRFGKTLTLNMLQSFFEYGYDPNLFNGLEITKYPEICKEHQNQYPVIFLTFRDLDAPNFEENREMLCSAIFKEANRFDFLKQSPKLNQSEIQEYKKLLQGSKMRTNSIYNSLYTLIDVLYKHYEKEVVVLLDEYDVPLNKAHHEGYYKQMLPFIRNILRNGLKDNPKVKFAVITGCLKISKESIFTGLNNLAVYSMTSDSFADGFGFTKKEVINLLEYYKLQDKYELIKEWYDGYRLGEEEIYCPWDVLRYVAELSVNRNAMPVAYWLNTSSNDIIKTLLNKYGKKIKNEMSCLLNGDTISCKLDEEIVYDTLYDSVENIWSVLFATGYLRIEDKTWNDSQYIYQLKIPNKEIRIVFANFFEKWVIDSYQQGERKEELEKFCNAIEQRNVEGMESFLNSFLQNTLNIKDYSRQQAQREALYHGILLGLLEPQDERWYCNSNMETGKGYADIILSTQDNQIGFILELKYARSENLDLSCQEAIHQINSKDYIDYFRKNRYREVVKYAIAFFEKRCKVVVEKENL
jgi:transcriptional regulator with XRE-family HTH domain